MGELRWIAIPRRALRRYSTLRLLRETGGLIRRISRIRRGPRISYLRARAILRRMDRTPRNSVVQILVFSHWPIETRHYRTSIFAIRAGGDNFCPARGVKMNHIVHFNRIRRSRHYDS